MGGSKLMTASGSILLAIDNRFYRIAKRSTTECAAILDVCFQLQLLEGSLLQEAQQLLSRIVAMLTKLVRKHIDVI